MATTLRETPLHHVSFGNHFAPVTPSRARAGLSLVSAALNPAPASVESFVACWDGTAMAERANALIHPDLPGRAGTYTVPVA